MSGAVQSSRLVAERRLEGAQISEWIRAWFVGECEVAVVRGAAGYRVAIETQSGRMPTGEEIEIVVGLLAPAGLVVDYDNAEFELGVLTLNQRRMDD